MPQKTRTCSRCPRAIYSDNKTGLCIYCLHGEESPAVNTVPAVQAPPVEPAERLAFDRQLAAQRLAFTDLKAKYDAALAQIDRQAFALDYLDKIREGTPSTFSIEPKTPSGKNEATPVIVASDWHYEELVTRAQTSGLNEFNPEIADRRIHRFFQASLNLVQNHLNPGVRINTVVLALLGDFITGQIHEAENAENNALLPIPAILTVQDRIKRGIDFYLEHSPYNFIIPCKVGNHTRITKRVRAASETAHSLETLMYAYLAAAFINNERVQFVMDDGYHTYLDVYHKTLRFHHGHALKYQGGVGGLFIPAYKMIAKWDEGRHADLDIFGHWHQTKNGGKFYTNGSLIGYNAFAMRIGASYEEPQQTLFLVDQQRGITCTWPIYLETR